jgi:hypothetical protein
MVRYPSPEMVSNQQDFNDVIDAEFQDDPPPYSTLPPSRIGSVHGDESPPPYYARANTARTESIITTISHYGRVPHFYTSSELCMNIATAINEFYNSPDMSDWQRKVFLVGAILELSAVTIFAVLSLIFRNRRSKREERERPKQRGTFETGKQQQGLNSQYEKSVFAKRNNKDSNDSKQVNGSLEKILKSSERVRLHPRDWQKIDIGSSTRS